MSQLMRWLFLIALAGCTRAPLSPVDCATFTDEQSCEAAGCSVAFTCCPTNDFPGCVAKGDAYALPCAPTCPGASDTAEPADCSTITDQMSCDARADCYSLLAFGSPCNSNECPSFFAQCMSGPAACVSACGPPGDECAGDTAYASGDDGSVIGCVAIDHCQSGWSGTDSCAH